MPRKAYASSSSFALSEGFREAIIHITNLERRLSLCNAALIGHRGHVTRLEKEKAFLETRLAHWQEQAQDRGAN